MRFTKTLWDQYTQLIAPEFVWKDVSQPDPALYDLLDAEIDEVLTSSFEIGGFGA